MDLISTTGYAATGAMYLFLIVLLLTVWRGRKLGGYLLAACVASCAWSVILATGGAYAAIRPDVLFFIEVARVASWIAFLAILVRQLRVPVLYAFAPHAVWILTLVLGLLALMAGSVPGTSWALPKVMVFGGFATALSGLILIEQLYRNSTPDSRWSLRPLLYAVGGIFAYDLFVYTQGMLFIGIDMYAWVARGWVNLLFVPLLATAVRRNPTWELRIFVSRHVVFYTTTLVAVGIYLLATSFGGYLLIRFGGSWGAVARIVFFAGAAIVLFALLFSGTVRARFRVFLSKHFFQNKYDYRDEWRRLVATLAEFGDSSTRQVVIKAMAQIVDSPAGRLWVADEQSRLFRTAAIYGMDESAPDIRFDDPLITFIRREGWLVDLSEYADDPSRYSDLVLPDWLLRNKTAWLIVPLIARKNLLGVILLYASPGMPDLNYEDRDLLKMVGTHIAVHLAQEKSDSLLAEAQQFEAYNRLTAFLMHDLNNLVAQLSLIVKNAEKHKRNPQFIDDSISTLSNAVQRMESVLQQLKRGSTNVKVRPTRLHRVVDDAVRRSSNRAPAPQLLTNADERYVSVDPDQLETVLCHLIKNAQDATPPNGEIQVAVTYEPDCARVSVADTGKGMSDEFIAERLFRPFDSTKGSQGMGIGAYQAREFARKSGGDLLVDSAEGQGTTVTLVLPLVSR